MSQNMHCMIEMTIVEMTFLATSFVFTDPIVSKYTLSDAKSFSVVNHFYFHTISGLCLLQPLFRLLYIL